MKKLILSALFLMIFGAQYTFAKPIRIVFKKGATKATVSGYMRGYKSKAEYVIRLRAGQTLNVNSNKMITLSITDPLGEDATDYDLGCNGKKSISPTIAGDYKITVVECQKADAWRGKFNLNISAR